MTNFFDFQAFRILSIFENQKLSFQPINLNSLNFKKKRLKIRLKSKKFKMKSMEVQALKNEN